MLLLEILSDSPIFTCMKTKTILLGATLLPCLILCLVATAQTTPPTSDFYRLTIGFDIQPVRGML